MNNLIQDLDNFVNYINSITRLSQEKKNKIVKAIDVVENAIEEMNYK